MKNMAGEMLLDRAIFRVSSLLIAGGLVYSAAASEQKANKANIVLIMGDDIGFSDIGCYGSEISTPNLDKLAASGIRFRTFYNMAKCNPTRSSLLTGLYRPTVKDIKVIPQYLHDAGYVTIACGKEHFEWWVPESAHARNAFDYCFGFSVCNEHMIPPDRKFQKPFWDKDTILSVDEIEYTEPFYKSNVVTDYALKYLDEIKDTGKPFFLYLPYHAAHFPLQALPEDIARYRGKYKKGWEKVREARFEKQKELGIISQDTELPPMEGNVNKFRDRVKRERMESAPEPLRTFWHNFYKYRPWSSIDKKEQDALDLEMAVYAAMIDRMDQNIGRIIKKIKEMGAYDNTLIVYLSDNGACPYYSNRSISIPPGGADSYRSLHASWANVANTPFRFFKQYGHEGGCRTQGIFSWPAVIKNRGSITTQPGHIIDLLPTFLAVAGVKKPDYLPGSSLLPILEGKKRKTPDYFISGYGENFRMFRQGDWKIVRLNNGPWMLYNLADDATEMHNLADKFPEKLKQLNDAYHKAEK